MLWKTQTLHQQPLPVPPMPKLAIICAMSRNRVIGLNNQLPWHLPADLQFFKRTTLGKPIIMGRKTYDSIGRPLPGRSNIVVTRQPDFHVDGLYVANSLEEAMEIAKQLTQEDEYFVIGGAELYSQALPLAERLYLTEVDTDVEGDAFFPEINHKSWQIVTEQFHPVDAVNKLPVTFKLLELGL